MNLTTLAKVKAFLELTEDDWDGLIEEIIASVSKRAEAYCSREFEKAERVEYHDGGGQYIFLKNLPVAKIDSIIGAVDLDFDNCDLISADEYTLLPAGMVANRFGTWLYGLKGLQVTYTAGYDPFPDEEGEESEIPIPADLEMAIRNQVAYDFKRRKDIGLESISFPDGSIQKVNSGEFLPSVKSVLNRYRIRPYG